MKRGERERSGRGGRGGGKLSNNKKIMEASKESYANSSKEGREGGDGWRVMEKKMDALSK